MLTPVDTIKIFQKQTGNIKFPAGTIIFNQGEPGDTMFGIISGEVEFSLNDQIIESLYAGDIFGEGALINPEHKRLSKAVAKTDCELVSLDKDHFIFAVQETPLFALEVMRSLSVRLRNLKQHLV
jgi:hypothetical protein